MLWEPSAERIERAHLTAFARGVEERRGLRFDSYDALWRWSVDDPEGFWAEVWHALGVRASAPYDCVLGRSTMPGAEWFPGARLNFAEQCLASGDPDAVAIVHASESRPLATLTRGELRRDVNRCAAGLRALGVGPGDRVAAYLPNSVEAVVASLATASLGAIWSSCSPDFGARSVIDRLAQISPKVLFAVDGYRYGGKAFDRMDTVRELVAAMPTLERVVVLGYGEPEPPLDGLPGSLRWDALLDAGGPDAPVFAQVPFAHPLWVLYSSGTTGLPKAIVHCHGGVVVELLKLHFLHLDLHEDDRLFWFTTTGWMMWNFLVAALMTPAAIVLWDGSPAHPDLGRLWTLAEEAGITVFGTSASFIGSCLKGGIRPRDAGPLARLRAVGSTGSPLAPEGFDWVYRELGPDLWLNSLSGGTDVCTAFVGGVPTLPVTRGELQGRMLGAAVEAWSSDGEPLVGEVGELVITQPLPSMPVGFWNDPGGERYRESYFSAFPGVWRHGDWIELTERGTAVITGRSDATINRGGVRIGTAELYRAVLAVDEVVDALAVDLPLEGTDGWLALFVVLRVGVTLDETLDAAIRARIRSDCSPRHVPDAVIRVEEVPRTLSGKALELPVKRILLGESPETVVSLDALANPPALDAFVALAGTLRP
ncbi:MAG: acetoacetate--CoA ligase [Thermoleophilia bacterium]|nr:acetoacetate--CoA ligase [Thermoleophilia bacterium]